MSEYKLTVFREDGRVTQRTTIIADDVFQAMQMAHAYAGEDEWELTLHASTQEIEAQRATKH